MQIFKTKNGQDLIIRRPTPDDALDIINYSKALFSSTDQLLTTAEEYSMTVEKEKTWIDEFNKNPNALILVAQLSSEIAGLLFFLQNTKKKSAHTGEFGVSVHPQLQQQGIGRKLIETFLDWARANPMIEKVSLNVFATNSNALALYNQLGFIEEGKFVNAVKQPTGEYVDTIQMYIDTR